MVYPTNVILISLKKEEGTSPVVQWLRLHASTAGDMGLIPGRGTKIPHAAGHSHKRKKKNKEGNSDTYYNVDEP